jgi:hypothetical protein
MWWLIALRGLRRGEAAGLRWADLDLAQRVIMIDQQPTTAPTRRTGHRRKGVARVRLCIHHARRHTATPRLDHPPVPSPGHQVRPAAGAAAQSAPRRGNPRACRRRRSEDCAGAARAHQHRAHRRHLHQRPARTAFQGRRSHRPTGARRGRPQPRPNAVLDGRYTPTTWWGLAPGDAACPFRSGEVVSVRWVRAAAARRAPSQVPAPPVARWPGGPATRCAGPPRSPATAPATRPPRRRR